MKLLRALAASFAMITLAIAPSASAATLESYSRLPAMEEVDISPDGQTVAYIAAQSDQQSVIVRALTGEVLQQADFGSNKVRAVQWAGNDFVVVTTSTTDSIPGVTYVGEFLQAVSINIRTGEVAQLLRRVRGNQTYANVLFSYPVTGVYEGRPVAYLEALAGAATSMTRRIDLVRVDLRDGTTRQHQLGGEYATSFLVTPDGEVVAQSNYEQGRGRWWMSVRPPGGGAMRDAYEERALIDRPSLGGLTPDGASVLVNVWHEEEQEWRYAPVSRATGAMGAPILPPRSGPLYDQHARLIGYGQVGHFVSYTFLNPEHSAIWEGITAALPGRQIWLTSFTPDFSRLVVRVEGTGFPGNYFLFDVATQRLSQLGRMYPDIAASDIGEVRAISYAAGDGLQIPAYLTLPPGRDPRNLPLIVLPHGGPQARDIAGFDWMAQSLASRGYAVLQPQFRGSTGQGVAFIEAGYGQWGRKMQTDLSDGITYLANQGIVDPSRVCIMGGSYGGYAALAGVTLQRDIYRCAVSIAGVSDVAEFIRDDVRRGGRNNSSYRYWTRFLGVERFEDPSLQRISTVAAAANGTAPVLLIHGRDDTVVPFAQSTRMEEALRAAGRQVELVALAREDHHLSREATRIETMRAAVAFLERHNPPN